MDPQCCIATVRLNGTIAVPGTMTILSPDGYFIQPMINPQGDQVVFWGRQRGEVGFNIWRYDLNGSGLKKLTDDRVVTGHPFWSADGQRLVYFSTLEAS